MVSEIRGNLAVAQGGGPTAVINASLVGVIQEALAHSDAITGVSAPSTASRASSTKTWPI